MSGKNIYLASKPRYEILDGLRGVAAIMVIIFHLFETYSKGPAYQIVNHGYLAVDFFFILSGFVIGYAYDDRWDRMTTWGFFKRRLVRLHPMVIFSMVVGASLFFFSDAPGFPNVMKTEWWQFAICFVLGLFLLPCGSRLDIRGWGEMNSFNGPSWTLMFEYIGNILYAFILRRLPKLVLALLCLGCAFFTLDLTMGWDVFNLFPEPKYNIIGGWSLTAQQIYVGFARLLFPFLCGLLISRILPSRMTAGNPSGSPIHIKGGFWWCALVLVVLFSIPCIGGKSGVPDGLYQCFCIFLMFPLVVLAGAGSVTRGAFSTKICKFLGDISYPVYITHYPLMYLQMTWAQHHPEAPLWMHVTVSVGVFVLSIWAAWAAFKLYDLPVRRWLTEHWLKRAPKKA